MFNKFYSVAFILCVIWNNCVAQSNTTFVKINYTDAVPKINFKETAFSDSLKAIASVKNFIIELTQNGYLFASIDSIAKQNDTVLVNIFTGKKFELDVLIESKNNLNGVEAKNKYSPTKLIEAKESIIKNLENNGYPFAKIVIDSIETETNSIRTIFKIEKGELYKIDSIAISGKSKISDIYLQRIIDIEPGDIYNEKKISDIDKNIRKAPFLNLTDAVKLKFDRQKVKIVLPVDPKNANQIVGILGLAQNSKNNKKVDFTGDISLLLVNLLNKGDLLNLEWKKPDTYSQSLTLNGSLPVLLKTPVGINANLYIQKKDTSYINVNTQLGIQYLLKGGDVISLQYKRKSSSNLLNDSLLAIADLNSNLVGIQYKSDKRNNSINPRSGYLIQIGLFSGKKKNTIKDSSQTNTEVEAKLVSGIFIPVKQKMCIGLQFDAGVLKSPKLYKNELYEIGGINKPRGFDEHSILASSYYISTVDFRYLFEQNSSVFIFADYCYLERTIVNEKYKNNLTSIGAGVNMETKGGIFTFIYALGKGEAQIFEFRKSKIHFGYINRF